MAAKENWSSRWGFLLATAGSAIGLGNIWKFPYITGMNGGAAFVCVYLLCILFLGLPLMLCELALGRATGSNPVGAFNRFTHSRRTPFSDFSGGLMILSAILCAIFGDWGFAFLLLVGGICLMYFSWRCIGVLTGIIVPVLILSYYGVIGGWTLLYIQKALAGQIAFTAPDAANQVLMPILRADDELILPLLTAQFLFMTAAGSVVFFGVRKGIERTSKILMPLLFLLLLVLVLRGVTLPGAKRGIRFFLAPDFSALTGDSILSAMGHAFFTLSLAMGITITYGSYLKRDENIVKSAFAIIGLDTLAAVLAGLAIFSAVFAMGFDPQGGPGLVFLIIPSAFNRIPGGLGWLWNTLFFIMLCIAALTSAISLLEPVVNFCGEQLRMRRKFAAVLCVILISALGTLSALSVADWKHLPALRDFFQNTFGTSHTNFFDMLDDFCSNWLLPIGGFAIAAFVGWIWTARRALKELRKGTGPGFDTNLILLASGLQARPSKNERPSGGLFTPAILWAVSTRWITPVLILFAFLYGVGAFKNAGDTPNGPAQPPAQEQPAK